LLGLAINAELVLVVKYLGDEAVLTHQVSGGAGWADLQHALVETSGEEMLFGRRLDGGWRFGGLLL